MSDSDIPTAPADIDSFIEESGRDAESGADKKPVELNPGEAAIGGELLEQIVEGALLAAGKPLTILELAALFESHERPGADAFRAALASIGERHAGRGFELREVASGWRFQVVQDVAPWIARLWEEKPQRYSRALLETLALIAYRQPITRGDIEDIRGVAVASNIVKTLLEREWVRVVGHKDVPGRPAMYATTRKFLDYFNLKNLEDLPALAEIRDLDSMNAELSLEGADTPLMDMAGRETDSDTDTDNDNVDDETSGDEMPDDASLATHDHIVDNRDIEQDPPETAPVDFHDDGNDQMNITADDGDEPQPR